MHSDRLIPPPPGQAPCDNLGKHLPRCRAMQGHAEIGNFSTLFNSGHFWLLLATFGGFCHSWPLLATFGPFLTIFLIFAYVQPFGLFFALFFGDVCSAFRVGLAFFLTILNLCWHFVVVNVFLHVFGNF